MPPRRGNRAQKGNDAAVELNTDDGPRAGSSPGGADAVMTDATLVRGASDVPGSLGGASANPESDTTETLDTDLVTQLQTDLALVCEHLFVGIGSLQRDARPVPLGDEEVVGRAGTTTAAISDKIASGWSAGGGTNRDQGSGAQQPDTGIQIDDEDDITSKARRMGTELGKSLRQLERHIQMLPDGILYDTSMRRGGEGVESAEVRALLDENRALREQLEVIVSERAEEVRALEKEHRLAVEGLLRASCGEHRSNGHTEDGMQDG